MCLHCHKWLVHPRKERRATKKRVAAIPLRADSLRPPLYFALRTVISQNLGHFQFALD